MGERRRSPGLLMTWLMSALAVWLTAWLLPGVEVAGLFPRAFVVAVVLGFLNATIRPVLHVLAFPVTVVTLGLFALVVNAGVLMLASWMLAGFTITSLGSGILASVVLTVVTAVLHRVFGYDRD